VANIEIDSSPIINSGDLQWIKETLQNDRYMG